MEFHWVGLRLCDVVPDQYSSLIKIVYLPWWHASSRNGACIILKIRPTVVVVLVILRVWDSSLQRIQYPFVHSRLDYATLSLLYHTSVAERQNCIRAESYTIILECIRLEL